LIAENNIKLKGYEPISMKSQNAIPKESALERSNNLINSMNDGDKISEQGVDIERVGNDYFVSYTTEDGGKVSKRKSNKTEALKTLSSKIAKSRAGKNIDLKEYKTEKVNGQDLKVGDIYSRVINGTRYVFKVLSKPYLPTKGMRALGDMNMDVEVLHVGNQVSEMPKSSGTGALVENEYTKKVGDKTIDTFRTKSSSELLLGKVDKINNWKQESAPSLVEQTKQAPKAVVKEEGATAEGVSETKEKAVRRKPIAGIDKSSSPKAKEIAEKLKFSPNEFKGDESPKDVGLVDTIEVFDKGTGRREVKDKPMAAVIRAAYDKGDITKEEANILEEALEAKKKAYTEAKTKPKSESVKKAEEFRDMVYNKIKEGKIEGVVGLNAAIYNKVLDLAAELFKGGMNGYIALKTALDVVLTRELAEGNITNDEYVEYKTEILEMEGLEKPSEFSGVKNSTLSPESKKIFKEALDKDKLTPEQLIQLGKKALDEGHVDPAKILDDFAQGNRDFLFNEPLNLVEQMAMHNYAVKIDSEIRDVNNKFADFVKSGEYNPKKREALSNKLKDLENKKLQFETFLRTTNYHKGISLYLNRLMLDNEFSLANQIAEYEKSNENGEGKVPDDVRKKFTEWSKELEEAKDELSKKEKEIEEEHDADIIENIKSDISEEEKEKKQKPSKTVKEKSKDLANRLRGNKINRPGIFMAATPASLAFDTAIEVAAKAIETTGSIISAVNSAVKSIKETDWYKNLDSDSKKAAEKELRSYIRANTSDLTVSADGEIKIPKSVIRQFVLEGANTIEELVQKTMAKFKEDNPGVEVSERQVRDAITGYGVEKGMTEDNIQDAINIMKSIGRQISTLEDIKNGLAKPLKKNVRKAKEERQKVLIKEIKDALNNLPLSVEQEAEIDANRLEQYKRRQEKTLEELERRLREGDFSKRPKPKAVKLDEDAKKLDKKIKALKDKFILEQERNKRRNRKKGQIIKEAFFESLLVQKTLQLSADLSAVRQAMPLIIRMTYHNPSSVLTFFKNLHKMAGIVPKTNPLKNPKKYTKELLNSLIDENNGKKVYDEVMDKMQETEAYDLAKKSGLFLIEENAKMTAKEESFQSKFAKHLPFLGAPINTKIKGVRIIVPGLDVFGRGERSFSAINELKLAEFMMEAEKLREAGITFENSPETYKALGDLLNTFAGRGSFKNKTIDNFMNYLNLGFISARFVKSRFDLSLFNPMMWVNFAKMPKEIKIVALKKMGALNAYRASIYGLLWIIAKYDDDDDTEFSIDPRSPNFLKFKYGDISIDAGLGVATVDKLLLQTYSSLLGLGTKFTRSGELKQINDEEQYDPMTYGNLYGYFILGKLNYVGKKAAQEFFNVKFENEDPEIYNFLPLTATGGIELSEQEEISTTQRILFNALNFYGAANINIDDYVPKPSKRRRRSSGGFGSSEFGSSGGFGSSEFGRSGGFGSGGGF
jgi:hypothetical protein